MTIDEMEEEERRVRADIDYAMEGDEETGRRPHGWWLREQYAELERLGESIRAAYEEGGKHD